MRSLLVALSALTLLIAQTPKTQTPATRKIAFARAGVQPGSRQLFVAASDGSGEHPLLTTPDTDYDAVWSPDGASIVFTSDRNGSADLFRVNPDGSGLAALTTDSAYDDQAAFSPDSKKLVFVSTRGHGTANLWTMDLATKTAKALTNGPGGDYRPSWSPDGKWIAFASGRGDSMPFAEGRWERLQLANIYIIHPDGSGLKKLTASADFCGSPKWTSDSASIVAYCMTAQQTMANRLSTPEPANDTRLVSIDIMTATSKDLAAGSGVKINPSPLGGSTLGGGEIGYIRKDSKEPGIYYSIGKRGPVGAIRTASWSPDGSHVVFGRRVTTPAVAVRKMFSRNPQYELSLTSLLPAFSPSGKQFVTNNFGGLSTLSVTTVETGHSEPIYQDKNRNILAGQWSPDGARIIFGLGKFEAFFDGFHSEFLKPDGRPESGAQVAMINADGTAFRELTALTTNAGPVNSAFPSFSPDGKRFVYRVFSKEGNGLRIMNLETGAVTTLTKAYDNFPLWSPKGDLIMFARLSDGAYLPGGAYDIYTIRPDGTALNRLTNGHGNDAHMGWSPDGEYIVFASSRMGFKDEVVYTDAPQPYGEIFVMKYDGTGVEQLTDNQWEDGTPAWQPVGGGVAPGK
jgi:Tol biopolymer transport system component